MEPARTINVARFAYCDNSGADDSAAHDEARLATIRARLERELEAAQRHSGARTYRPSRWVHVPLRTLIGAHNTVQRKAAGKYVCGHEPLHRSRSGQCLVIWADEGRWWCSSCHRSGDAASWVMQVQGVTYPQAAAYLCERFGPPAGQSAAPRPRWRPVP
jgi:CHC2 zinc finger